MIKIAVLTTVWQRPILTSFHFHWMEQFRFDCKRLDLKIIPFYVLSENDPHLKLFKSQLKTYGHQHTVVPKQRLSDKSNAGLQELRDKISFDWLMHLDSDELLSMELMKQWKKQFEFETLWFGSKACYFVDIENGSAWEFKGYGKAHPVKNGGTCLHNHILEITDYKLWPESRSTGLNIMERNWVSQFGFNLASLDTQDYYGVLELKGGSTSIHDIKWFQERDMLIPQNLDVIVEHYSQIRVLI